MLGSYDNKMSEIRKSKWNDEVFKVKTPGILSEQQFRGFLIKYNRYKGELSVYSEGIPQPLLYWKDSDPLNVRFVSFSAYEGVLVQVAFNCKNSKDFALLSSTSKALSNSKLFYDIHKKDLHHYDSDCGYHPFRHPLSSHSSNRS